MADRMIYNSTQVRQAARTLQRGVNELNGSAVPELRSVRSALPDNFRGDAANALSNRLFELDADINKISAAMNKLSRALFAFADEIDRADQQIENALR